MLCVSIAQPRSTNCSSVSFASVKNWTGRPRYFSGSSTLGPLPQHLDPILCIPVVINSCAFVERSCKDVVEGCRPASVLPFEQLECCPGYDIRGTVVVKDEMQPVLVGAFPGCLRGLID